MIAELMAEGFGDPLLWHQERLPMPTNLMIVASQVIVAALPRGDADGEVPEGIPFQVEAPEAPASDFAL